MNESIVQLLTRAAAILRENRRVIACLLVKARGSTPQSAGALMLVDEAAKTWGTVGGGCVEAEIRRHALEMLHQGGSGLRSFKLDHDYGWDDGLICGGTIEMALAALPSIDALERAVSDIRARRSASLQFGVDVEGVPTCFTLEVLPRERLYIAGAGHVGQALARLALPLEFDVTLFDDREDLLRQFAPAGCAIVAGDIAECLTQAAFDDRTYAVIVTRGHRHDEQALAASLSRRAAYVGMIGSRRKVKLIVDDLAAMGVAPAELQKVHAPIGLGIGAVTVEEIALSIAAELVQVRRSNHAAPVRVSEGKALPSANIAMPT